MSDKIGPLLTRTLNRMSAASNASEEAIMAAHHGGTGEDNELPLVIKLPHMQPQPGEDWKGYRKRVDHLTLPLREEWLRLLNITATPLYAANALKAKASPDQITRLSTFTEIELMELDARVNVLQMDDVKGDVEVDMFQANNPTLNGSGVRVAVLDSGVDTKHPFLNVAASVSTTNESTNLPGMHATHCAGIIASQDGFYRGIAPGVTLLNVKVATRDGFSTHSEITRGIDEAIELDADVLSISVGYNHLPISSDGGHGWSCRTGDCTLCVAVNNAVAIKGAVVVVAAGNYHSHAEILRSIGRGDEFDTELVCPGQSHQAITVGAITKTTFVIWNSSSRGPTADGRSKPDLCAPGVNVKSTGIAPRNGIGNPLPNPPRSSLFSRDSGTSMATPMVAATAALLIQKKRAASQSWTPASIKEELLRLGTAILVGGPNAVGAGRLTLRNL